jgi:UDP-N-acetylglucosamine 2-epimerase (non-hydrolysing)
MKKILSVVGARPNFMKVAPLHRAFQKYRATVEHLICHTGQHYDEKMSKIFFDEFELPEPHFYLGVGSGSHAVQTAKIMMAFETVLLEQKPDLVIVVGDVNSTVACSLVASKLHIPVAHVEAGLRSFDRTMPEEINRLLTDAISDYLFVTEQSGIENLRREGVDDSKVFFVGNVMIDSLVHLLPKTDSSSIMQTFGIRPREYVLVTLHRPSNVDDEQFLRSLSRVFNTLSEKRKIVFPVHPRTRANIERLGLNGRLSERVILSDPIGYIDFLHLTKHAELVITDSGGIQEESTYLGVQCITVRNNTERPVTVDIGTNQLIGTDLDRVMEAALEVLGGTVKSGRIPELWDGKAAERIAKIVSQNIEQN